MKLKFAGFMLCLICTSYAYSQSYSTYVLHDGTEIRYKKSDHVKGTRDVIVKLFDTGEKMTISLDQIKGQYNSRELVFYYLKENWPGSSQYIDHVLSGKINTYQIIENIGSSSFIVYHYAEKDSTIQLIRSSGIGNGTAKQLELFKSMIEDDPIVLAKVNELNRLSIKNFTRFVKEYNVNKFNPDSVTSTPATNDVELVFYRKDDKEPLDAIISLTGEDSVMTLQSRDVIKVKIKNTGLKKLCFDSAKNQCELLEVYPYFKKLYYQIEFDSEAKTFSIAPPIDLARAKLHVHEIEYYRKKKASGK